MSSSLIAVLAAELIIQIPFKSCSAVPNVVSISVWNSVAACRFCLFARRFDVDSMSIARSLLSEGHCSRSFQSICVPDVGTADKDSC